jgi:hypothetical protein
MAVRRQSLLLIPLVMQAVLGAVGQLTQFPTITMLSVVLELLDKAIKVELDYGLIHFMQLVAAVEREPLELMQMDLMAVEQVE